MNTQRLLASFSTPNRGRRGYWFAASVLLFTPGVLAAPPAINSELPRQFLNSAMSKTPVTGNFTAIPVSSDPVQNGPDLQTAINNAQPGDELLPPAGSTFQEPITLASQAKCRVTPLPAITDDEALAFEKGISPDIGALSPAMAGALRKFQQLVSSVGGTFELKSAYRPPSYQAHLQVVWVKWMLELRNNREPGCQTLRRQVGEEFARHRLLETQKPVTSSDHTRGLAFDATVVVPRVAWLKKRRVSLDRLALMAGIQRPDILRDPVHFKLAIGRGIRRA
jgi:hypothetical protein